MSRLQCTPGPWEVVDKYNGVIPIDAWDQIDGSSVEVCRVGNEVEEQQKANAYLIAASPDLYAFAEAFESVIKGSGHNLCSTATEAERTAFISGILNVWNTHYPALDKARVIQ